MKRQILTALAVFAVVITVLTILICYEKKPVKTTDKEAQTTEITTYVLKDYNGRIAVFENDSKSPVKVYEVNTSSLPEADAEKIREGIKANNKTELHDLIETFLS